MDCFYIITNKLKDKDYAITSQIEQYIQSSGKKCFLSEKDSEAILFRELFLRKQNADWY